MVMIQIVGASLATYLVVKHERRQAYAAFDASLGENVAVLRSLIEAPEEVTDRFIFHREFVTLSPEARFFIRESTGRRIDGSKGWNGPETLPPRPGGFVDFTLDNIRYRALVERRLPVVDQEFQDPTSPKITLAYAAPTAPVEAHIHSVELQAIGICLALLFALTTVTAGAIGSGLQPLRDLARSVGSIDVDRWTFAEIERSKRVAELAPLAQAMVHLVERLHVAFERERRFFGDAAHEMKSSISIVRSTLQFALQSDRSAIEYRSEMSDALADTDRLQVLVGSMLDLARIERMNPEAPNLPRPKTEARAQAQLVLNRFQPFAKLKAIHIVLQSTSREVWVPMTDEGLLTVLSNLVENAIHYSSSGRQITIEIQADHVVCNLSVIDEGCGIAASDLPRIFDRFYRSDESRARATGGVGLGLSIAQALVVRSQGSISVQSELGRGTSFIITLPTA
jgi:signal transduction histidine kinase